MQGRRRDPDVDPLHYEPGDYGKRATVARAGGPVFDAWWVRCPNGALGRLHAPEDDFPGGFHEVEEHDDGTITVERHDHNSNSILVTGHPSSGRLVAGAPMSWHGYIEHGVWRAI